ncbi:hypothetical protein [Sphingopyxis sp. 22461]|uniref:hypothetical protein n=1 Tax=Sphingopyxis sp. 22461 TaxID=3453923 RepID=UPI003F876453
MQIFDMDAFWARYGKTDFDSTAFAKALDRLPDISERGPWIGGGSVRRLIAGQPQDSDFDFFFADQAQFDAFCKDMKKRGADVQHENDFNITFLLPKAKAKPIGDDEFTVAGPELKVQAIRLRFHPTLAETLEGFDFSLCKFGYDGTRLICGDYSLFDLASKRLVPDRISFGTSTLRRIIKYTKQGYTICSGGLASILQQVVDDPSIIQAEVEYVD